MHPAGDRSTGYAIAAPPVTTVAVAGTDAVFPVARVYCVGRNYAEHSIEMGHDPEREPPFFFMKPADAVVPPGRLPFPTQTQRAAPRDRAGGRARRGRHGTSRWIGRSTTSSGTPWGWT